MIRSAGLAGLISAALATAVSAQTAPTARMDVLLERLVGRWTMTGSVRGKPSGTPSMPPGCCKVNSSSSTWRM